jgi:inward rectifier potassium channel
MKIKKNVLDFIKNTGFSSIPRNEGTRLINKNGTINIKRTGLKFSQRFDVFHWLINMKWPTFFLLLFVGFIIANTFFALIYVSLGIEGLSGVYSNKWFEQFMEAFYFSAQTLTTLGYGAISPLSTGHNIVASFEAFIGLLSFATSTGLLYGRFSRPKAKIMFSNQALVSPYRETGKGLMVRLINSKDDQLININASLILSWLDAIDDARKFQKLELEMNRIEMLVSSWTIVHPITENSPLANWGAQKSEDRDLEIYLQIDAYDETYSQQIHTRTSYKFDEVVWGAKFKPILGNNDQGQATLNLEFFHDYDSAPLKEN